MNIRVMLGIATVAGLLSVAEAAATPAAVATYSSHADELTESQKVERLIGYLRSLDVPFLSGTGVSTATKRRPTTCRLNGRSTGMRFVPRWNSLKILPRPPALRA